MSEYEFDVYFSGYHELNTELEDAVYEAGCSDGLLGVCNGRFSIHFGREAETFADAVFSAFHDLKKVPGIEILQVEAEGEDHDVDIINRTLKLHQQTSAV